MKNSAMTRLALAVSAALMTGGVFGQSPYNEPDQALITLTGTVDEVYRDAFTLVYGEGSVTVEMDDGDRDADAYKLQHGDEVTVTGRVDRDFYEATTIEAGTVYMKNLDTYFYASALDEEDYHLPMYYPDDPSMETLQGRVTDVGEDDFTLATGDNKVTIEVDEMPHDPLDDRGFPRVDKNDIVSVRGHLDYDLFENHAFEAEGITIVLNTGP